MMWYLIKFEQHYFEIDGLLNINIHNNIISFVYLKYLIFVYGRHVLDNLNVFLIDDYDYVCLYVMIQNGYAS